MFDQFVQEQKQRIFREFVGWLIFLWDNKQNYLSIGPFEIHFCLIDREDGWMALANPSIRRTDGKKP